jgi:hypothetical protein
MQEQTAAGTSDAFLASFAMVLDLGAAFLMARAVDRHAA